MAKSKKTKIHKKIDGQILQMNKQFSNLKMKQKDKITEWVYEEYKKYVTEHDKVPDLLADDKHCPGYKKGDRITIWKIAENYITAIKNGEWSLNRVKDELATASNEDDKTKILYFTDSTFTNVHEVLAELEQSIN